MMSRRTFIAAGIAGGAALAAAHWWRASRREPSIGPVAFDAATRDVVVAIVPAMLADALPAEPRERAAATAATADGVWQAIAGLPSASQRELAELFSLLAFAPARVALARVSAPWPDASADEVAAFLERWRASGFTLLRSAYGALHQLVYAAWYGQPASWPAIGYPGPPRLAP
jgi:hypothetical protein